MKLSPILLFTLTFCLFACATPSSTNLSAVTTTTSVAPTTIANGVATETPIPPTATSTFTPTPIATLTTPTQTPSPLPQVSPLPARSPIPTFTPRPTLTPTNTPVPKDTPIPAANLSIPGVPPNPISDVHHYSDTIDKTKAHLYTYQAHQRQVLVYFDDEGILDASQEKAIANWCFEAWTRAWEIFGGYAYTTYECVASNRHRGAGSGVTVGNSTILDSAYLKLLSSSALSPELRLNYQEAFRHLMTHEVFHAWDYGHMLVRVPWFYEGGADYYGAYLSGYPNNLVSLVGTVKEYARIMETGRDRILSSITIREPAGIGYTKGALVFYMLDQEISERTQGQKSMDHVMRRLYSQQWQTAAPIAATPIGRATPAPLSIDVFREAIIAEAGNADFFNAFFLDYVDGARDLREWHNGLLKLDPTKNFTLSYPPHPAIK